MGQKVVNLAEHFVLSNHKWEWLGPGVYFWENNQARALHWAQHLSANGLRGLKDGVVVGALVELGLCLDLTQHECLEEMRRAHNSLSLACKTFNQKLPVNDNRGGRNLDCAVIIELHRLRRINKLAPYETVRAPFGEQGCLYDGTEFTLGGHTQIAVLNRNCIKAVFWPRQPMPWPPRGRPAKPRGKLNTAPLMPET